MRCGTGTTFMSSDVFVSWSFVSSFTLSSCSCSITNWPYALCATPILRALHQRAIASFTTPSFHYRFHILLLTSAVKALTYCWTERHQFVRSILPEQKENRMWNLMFCSTEHWHKNEILGFLLDASTHLMFSSLFTRYVKKGVGGAQNLPKFILQYGGLQIID